MCGVVLVGFKRYRSHSRYSKEPLFVKKPRSSEAYEGDTVIIQCEVVGDPKPDVVWLRDFLKVCTLFLCAFAHTKKCSVSSRADRDVH